MPSRFIFGNPSSDVEHALRAPATVVVLLHRELGERCALHLDGRRVTLDIDRFATRFGLDRAVRDADGEAGEQQVPGGHVEDEAVEPFVQQQLEVSTRVIDLARALVPNAKMDIIGIRPGEKLHEDLISDDEARHTIELDRMYVIQPAEAIWFGYSWKDKGKPLPEGFTYTSDNNSEWLDIEGIRKFVAPFEDLFRQGKLEG